MAMRSNTFRTDSSIFLLVSLLALAFVFPCNRCILWPLIGMEFINFLSGSKIGGFCDYIRPSDDRGSEIESESSGMLNFFINRSCIYGCGFAYCYVCADVALSFALCAKYASRSPLSSALTSRHLFNILLILMWP
jgi:hypothetical protein